MSNNTETELDDILKQIDHFHPSDIAYRLKKIKKNSNELFYEYLHKIPKQYLGEVLLELPESLREKAYNSLSHEQISRALEKLETDNATDIIQGIEEIDQEKAKNVLDSLDKKDQDDINWLKKYDETKAGAYMQTELFSAHINETIQDSIDRLKFLKKNHHIENIHQVFVVDDDTTLLASIPLEDLVTYDFKLKYKKILEKNKEKNYKPISVVGDDNIGDVVKQFEKYNLSVVSVIGYKNRLLGRITSDDILDVIEQNATEQMYQLAGVDEDYEQDEELFQTGRKRASWLFINLLTAIMASLVIGFFDETIKEYIALAILMPIVASMGGNAGTQTLAVMVRQLALGDIDEYNSNYAVKKEIFLSLLNGILFAVILGAIAFAWFESAMLGFVIALSMIITLFCAGFFWCNYTIGIKKNRDRPSYRKYCYTYYSNRHHGIF